MAKTTYTLDDLALLLLQVEPEQTAELRTVRDRLRRVSRRRSLDAGVAAELEAAASALSTGLAGGPPDREGAIAAAGKHIEAAMRIADAPPAPRPRGAPVEAEKASGAEPEAGAGEETLAEGDAAGPSEGVFEISAAMLAFAESLPTRAELYGEAAPGEAAESVAATGSSAEEGGSGFDISPDMLAFAESLPSAADFEAPAQEASEVVGAAAGSDIPAIEWQTKLPSDADPELVDGFAAECQEYLEGAEAALLTLEASPDTAEAINTVFRCFHTMKGTSAFLGLDALSTLAHRAESLLSRARDGQILLTGGYADLALRSVDVLRTLVEEVRGALGGGTLREPSGYRQLLWALASPEAAMEATAAAPAVGRPDTSPLAVAMEQEPAGEGDRSREGDGGKNEHAADSWVRVRTDRLDRLVDTIGELVIAQSMIAQGGVAVAGGNEVMVRKIMHATKIVRELQDLSISMRMVPLKSLFQKLARVLRDAAHRSGKQVELVTAGEETEIDRSMVEIVGDPLVHMIRNAVDHGIEPPDERERAGKARTGTVRLSAFHAGGNVVVELQDDGRGLDRGRILEKAIAKGLIEGDRHLGDRDIFELIFAPGFSTAATVTELSGRGVGLDVVKRSVESLRGRVDIESTPGDGTTFSIRLPLTLAMTDGMLVRVGSERYIIPTVNIEMSFRPSPDALSTVGGRGEMVMLRNEVLPLVRLHEAFQIEDAEEDPTKALLVVLGSAERRSAVLVDELLGQYQVVAKSLGDGIGRVAGVSGGAILGDGRVGLILDVAEVVNLGRERVGGAAAESAAA